MHIGQIIIYWGIHTLDAIQTVSFVGVPQIIFILFYSKEFDCFVFVFVHFSSSVLSSKCGPITGICHSLYDTNAIPFMPNLFRNHLYTESLEPPNRFYSIDIYSPHFSTFLYHFVVRANRGWPTQWKPLKFDDSAARPWHTRAHRHTDTPTQMSRTPNALNWSFRRIELSITRTSRIICLHAL